jgi:hypothetical protein
MAEYVTVMLSECGWTASWLSRANVLALQSTKKPQVGSSQLRRLTLGMAGADTWIGLDQINEELSDRE